MKFNDFMNKDKWRARTIILAVFLIISIGYMFYSEYKIEQEYMDSICSRVQGTPSWADENGFIIGSGYTTFGNETWNVVEEVLIPNKIMFIYNSNCGWCQKQIEYFGTTWEKYIKSGLTIKC